MQKNNDIDFQELFCAIARKIKKTTPPFFVNLFESDDVLFCTDVVRVLPGKRLVAFGTWKNKAVVAKLFFARGTAARHATRDYQGMKVLSDAAVLVPAIYYRGTSKDKRIHILIFEKIIGLSVDARLQDKKNIADMHRLMRAMTIEIATQHVLGIVQHDLHFKNFLVQKKTYL